MRKHQQRTPEAWLRHSVQIGAAESFGHSIQQAVLQAVEKYSFEDGAEGHGLVAHADNVVVGDPRSALHLHDARVELFLEGVPDQEVPLVAYYGHLQQRVHLACYCHDTSQREHVFCGDLVAGASSRPRRASGDRGGSTPESRRASRDVLVAASASASASLQRNMCRRIVDYVWGTRASRAVLTKERGSARAER
ncbi:hypothetical protein DBV15_04488 [Temnothorax longispinosus]|uniref:Uncharacterized protein n=1 Tax=Temnothorax longispinosus TaxID=300112 RepID=A0A4S2KAT4_9HYME|nr:hypothetical protein DBV15_04488 [Temnothorax longispinosus]